MVISNWILFFLVIITIFIQAMGGGIVEIDVQHVNFVPLTHPFVTCTLWNKTWFGVNTTKDWTLVAASLGQSCLVYKGAIQELVAQGLYIPDDAY